MHNATYIALAALLGAAPAAAQVYRCDADGHTTYQNSPCAPGAAARVIDATNAAFGAQVVDHGALARLQARERIEIAERRAAESSARAQSRIEAQSAARGAELRARQDQAAGLFAIADELRLARLDGIGVPGYVAPRRDWRLYPRQEGRP